MKLLNKFSRVHIITATTVLLVGTVAYYFIIQFFLLGQIDGDLMVEEQEIKDFISAKQVLPDASDYGHQLIRFEPLSESNFQRNISNIMEYDSSSMELEPYRRLAFPVNVKNNQYLVSVYKSRVETEDLFRLIMLATVGIFILLSFVIYIVNRLVLAKLWQPFFNTLFELRNFNLHNHKQLKLARSNIQEFEELNFSVSQMTEKINNEYETLKSFTDNASHEMQTPLAIIRSKLDLLLQSSTEQQADSLQAIYDATGRLSKLNQVLLLLTKIDNKQFQPAETIKLKVALDNKFQQFDELIKARNLQLLHKMDDVSITINRELLDILLNNLMSNAIKHTEPNGTIECKLSPGILMLANTGQALHLDNHNIFERFQKSNRSEGLGLGLAIVKQVCEACGMEINYTHDDKFHQFIIRF